MLSVVVVTLDGRDALSSCLDALAAVTPGEVIVANGPSTDGTSGMVRNREDVDVLVELADRNVNAARNAGFEVARGDAIAFLDERSVVEPGWGAGIDDALAGGADVMTGPVVGGREAPERTRLGGRDVLYFGGGNVAFTREAFARLDGFDEYLPVGGSRDAAHRVAGLDLDAEWRPEVAVRREETRPDGGGHGWKYRSLAYRLAKNYGPRPGVARRALRHAIGGGISAFREVLAGDRRASSWLGDGRDVAGAILRGTLDGLRARYRDRRPARNPNGVSSRSDRAISVTDRR